MADEDRYDVGRDAAKRTGRAGEHPESRQKVGTDKARLRAARSTFSHTGARIPMATAADLEPARQRRLGRDALRSANVKRQRAWQQSQISTQAGIPRRKR